jgi:hypothetical protein
MTPALESLLGYVKKGECIVFLGSGIHAPPPKESHYKYPEEQRPPVGRALAEILAESSGFKKEFPDESSGDLMRVSLFIETTPGLGRKYLIDSLDSHLRGEEGNEKVPSPAVKMLAELPFKIFVTTNYDLLLDDALNECKKKPYRILYSKSPDEPTKAIDKDPTAQRPLLFKMHGDLDERKAIVITDEDYITFVQRMSDKEQVHPVPRIIRDGMTRWPTLFIGYSLRDYNLRLLLRTLRWRVDESVIPVSFALDMKPDLLIRRVWQDKKQYVAFVVEDLWTFMPWLYKEIEGKEYPA